MIRYVLSPSKLADNLIENFRRRSASMPLVLAAVEQSVPLIRRVYRNWVILIVISAASGLATVALTGIAAIAGYPLALNLAFLSSIIGAFSVLAWKKIASILWIDVIQVFYPLLFSMMSMATAYDMRAKFREKDCSSNESEAFFDEFLEGTNDEVAGETAALRAPSRVGWANQLFIADMYATIGNIYEAARQTRAAREQEE